MFYIMNFKWRLQKSSPHQFIVRYLCPCRVPLSLFTYRWELHGLFWTLQYLCTSQTQQFLSPAFSASSDTSNKLLLTQGPLLPLWKIKIFSPDLVQDSSQKYFKPAHTGTNITLFFFPFPIVSSRSQVRYTYTKKTNQRKTLKRYSFLPEREKVKPDADFYIFPFLVSYICYLLYLLMVIKLSNTLMLSRAQLINIRGWSGWKHRLGDYDNCFMCIRNALWPCETSWMEKAARVAAVPPAEDSPGRGRLKNQSKAHPRISKIPNDGFVSPILPCWPL